VNSIDSINEYSYDLEPLGILGKSQNSTRQIKFENTNDGHGGNLDKNSGSPDTQRSSNLEIGNEILGDGPTPRKNIDLLYPVKLIFDYIISPFKTNKSSRDKDTIQEADKISTELDETKAINDQISSEIMVQEPVYISSVKTETEYYTMADEVLSSELSPDDKNEIVCDSQNEVDDEAYSNAKRLSIELAWDSTQTFNKEMEDEIVIEAFPVGNAIPSTKKAQKRIPRQDSAILSTKPRIAIKYNPNQRSNLREYIDILENRKRRRLK
jgi:hypothetical protein